MRSRSALALGMARLFQRDHADARLVQLLFGIPLAVDTGLLWWHGVSFTHDYLVGLAIVGAATLVVMLGTRRSQASWAILVPAADIVAVGWLRLVPESTAAMLWVFPALWLGLQFGRRGVSMTVSSVLVSFSLPVLLGGQRTLDGDAMIQESVLALLVSGLVALSATAWQETVDHSEDTQRMLERAVADSAEQRRLNDAILTSVDVGLLALDATGKVQLSNPRLDRFLKLAYPDGFENLLEDKGFTFGADGFTELAAEQLPTARAVNGEALRDYLVWAGEDPATRRAFAVSLSPFISPDGVFDGAVLAYHDITELMTAARVKDEFVATVSHELRTPLTSIVGYIDLLIEDIEGIPPEARPFLDTVQRNARRLNRLVDDLLSDALQLGKAELRLGRISLPSVVRQCAIEAEKSAAAAGIDLDVDVGRALLEVNGDSERLAQVIDNIFNNAIKFTPSGGRISGSVTREGREALVRITDTGRGIPPEELQEVFVKFFRSPGVQMDAIPGTGLGLAISKAIVEAHGGRIDLDSEVGVGTTLEVRLPLAGPRVARSG